MLLTLMPCGPISPLSFAKESHTWHDLCGLSGLFLVKNCIDFANWIRSSTRTLFFGDMDGTFFKCVWIIEIGQVNMAFRKDDKMPSKPNYHPHRTLYVEKPPVNNAPTTLIAETKRNHTNQATIFKSVWWFVRLSAASRPMHAVLE